MLHSYLKIAWRNLLRNKVFSCINLLGLSVSLVVCLLIFQFILFELSYDDFHIKAPDIYRVSTKVRLHNEEITESSSTYYGISDALKTEYPEVDDVTTIRQFTSDNTFIRYEDANGTIVPIPSFKGIETDSAFFNVFSFELLEGSQSTVLRNPYSIVISETLANTYFSGNAIGKPVELYDGFETRRYQITGVCKNVAANSHVKFDLITTREPRKINFWNDDISFWDWTDQTYIVLNKNASPAALEAKLNEFAAANAGLKRNPNDYGQISTFDLQALTDIHLFSRLSDELEPGGSASLVYALILLAAIIMMVAWVNYINLSTALTENRIRTIGVRKVVGASRGALIFQILIEAVLFNTLAVGIAWLSVGLLQPAFTEFAGVPLNNLLGGRWLFVITLATVAAGGIVSGVYPAIVISSFQAVSALKGKSRTGGASFRRALVIFQFGIAVALIVITMVSNQQLSFMQNKDLGIGVDKVIILKALNFDKEVWSNEDGGYVIDSAYLSKAENFKEDVKKHTWFEGATTLSHLPGQLPNWGTEFKAVSGQSDNAYRLVAMGVDHDFLSTLQVKLLAGRNFSRDIPSDRGNEARRAVLLNEAASKLLGFRTPGNAVGKHISTYWGANYEVIGVVNSFHQLSLKEKLQPLYFLLQPRALEYYAVRYQTKTANEATQQLQSIWQRHFPDYPFSSFYLDEYFNQQYTDDKKFGGVMTVLSALAILISCLGLFGMTSLAMTQRTKEIGIRKVLGATASSVIGLFTSDFFRLIILADVIFIPIAYLVVDRWLGNYAFRITLDWWYFALPALLTLGIALVTITMQTFKAAIRNPVDSLRYD